jgi:protoheme IX farnesyltransferase
MRVAREIVAYSWLTVAATVAVWLVATGWVFGVLALAAGAVLLAGAHRLLWQTTSGRTTKPMQLFHLSNSYLAFVFVALAVDTFLR